MSASTRLRWYGRLALLALLACASCGVRLSPEMRAEIATVAVSPQVEVPDSIDTGDLGMVLVGGAVAAILDQISARQEADQLRAVMSANDIDMGRIVYETFRDRLAAGGAFVVVDPGASSAVLSMRVTALALARPIGSMSRLKPVVTILATLTRADGGVVWRQADNVGNLNTETPAYTYDEYVTEPEKLRTAFARAIAIAADGLLADLSRTEA
jgi:hypothetical protein